MKKTIFSALVFITSMTVAQPNKATFSYFQYIGKDVCNDQKIDLKTQYRNPILPGFYPDPSICRRGSDYFMVNSTFCYFPGIPIFHSKDMVHWNQIGNVLNRPSQLNVDKLTLSRGVFAPAIEYNPYNHTFYVINTVVEGINNFLVKTTNPFKDWGEPIKLPEINGIDPSLFFDDDGKAYIVFGGGPPAAPKWSGHRAIWLFGYDTSTDKVIPNGKVIVDGGVDTTQHPIWVEGPHLYKIKGKYYLMAAEGGTNENHSEVIFMSDRVDGPYLPCKINPILTQRDLPASRDNKVTSTGHADLLKTHKGDWVAVFLGCRPYSGILYNTGRETFMLPVEWKDDVPIILPKGEPVPTVVDFPSMNRKGSTQNGNFTWRDEFTSTTLDMKWLMVRVPQTQWWKLSKGSLQIEALARSLSQIVNPAFIARRQQHIRFEASTSVSFTPQSEKEMAGIAYFQNDKNYLAFGKTVRNGKPVIVLISVEQGKQKEIAIAEIIAANAINLHIFVDGGEATFSYNQNQLKPVTLISKVNIENLSTAKAGGFVGAVVGMYATGLGF